MRDLAGTQPISYICPKLLTCMDDHNRYGLDPMHRIPSHVVSLSDGKKYGVWLMLDIQTGMILSVSLIY